MSLAPAFKVLLERNGFFRRIRYGEAVIDLVCGMEVNKKTTKYKKSYQGKKYYFCSEMCRDHFEYDPEKYVG